MKIRLLTTSLAPKGPTRQLSYLCALQGSGAGVASICSLRHPRSTDWPHLFSENGTEVAYGLLDAFKVRHYDVVHTSGLIPDAIGLILSWWKPWVATVRNFPSEDYRPKFGLMLGSVFVWLHLFILYRCRNVVFCDDDLEKKFGRIGIQGKIVENASVDFFGDHKEFERSLLYCGALIPRKNIKLMSELYEKTALKQLKFVVYGEGPEESKLPKVDSVHFFGFENNIFEIHKKPRIFISLSRSEGLPNSALEAIAGACLLVLSNIPPHKKLASLFPELIMLIDLDDFSSKNFNSSFGEFLSSHSKIDWANIRDRYNRTYGKDRMFGEYLTIYRELVDEN